MKRNGGARLEINISGVQRKIQSKRWGIKKQVVTKGMGRPPQCIRSSKANRSLQSALPMLDQQASAHPVLLGVAYPRPSEYRHCRSPKT